MKDDVKNENQWGKELVNIEDCVDNSIQERGEYTEKIFF